MCKALDTAKFLPVKVCTASELAWFDLGRRSPFGAVCSIVELPSFLSGLPNKHLSKIPKKIHYLKAERLGFPMVYWANTDSHQLLRTSSRREDPLCSVCARPDAYWLIFIPKSYIALRRPMIQGIGLPVGLGHRRPAPGAELVLPALGALIRS